MMFQSTRPRGARRPAFTPQLSLYGFNPRARGGRDLRITPQWQTGAVSIHAPAGGATFIAGLATRLSQCFNPRARGGRDLLSFAWCWTGLVSIHAPAGGATICRSANGYRLKFQSTRPRGARPQSPLLSLSSPRFQSTRPRGARPLTHAHLSLDHGFQSTRPRGARPTFGCRRLRGCSFNPRARGGRDIFRRCSNAIWKFQSTRPRGARPLE